MIGFLTKNWGTILTGAIVLAAAVLAAARLVKDKRSGKACGGCPGCSKGFCAAEEVCHNKK